MLYRCNTQDIWLSELKEDIPKGSLETWHSNNLNDTAFLETEYKSAGKVLCDLGTTLVSPQG